MKLKISSFLLLLVLAQASSSPLAFEVADNYVKSFHNGIADLKKESEEYKPVERSYVAEFKDAHEPKIEQEFDFVIIGGGTAGSVLASRLSEIPEYTVLLLEAGGDETKITKVPALGKILRKSNYTWGYKSEPQETWCLGKETKQCYLPTGRILGGTSSINKMIYTRGNSRDYDLWADLDNKEWCYSDVLPYFKKSEGAHLHHFDRKHHHQGGPLSVEDPQYLTPLHQVFLSAAKECDLKLVDYNGKEQLGASIPQMNTKHGERSSTFDAYIRHARPRKNLLVLPYSHVIEIIVSTHTKEAQGVKYAHQGVVKVANARKEIILAAGAINSPQILKLSGVGPTEELEALQIETKENLEAVGKNLRDHPVIALKYHFEGPKGTIDHNNELVAYLRDGKGPLASTGVEGLAFIKTNASKDTAVYPDVFLEFIVGHHGDDFVVKIAVAHPKSTGYVKLKSADAFYEPLISPNHFSDEDDHDLATLLEGVRFAQHLLESVAFKELNATRVLEAVKGCELHEIDTDDYWKCAIKHDAESAGHFHGTCAMAKGPHKGVVDNKLRVHGVHKLRVADASVIPVPITGHTQAATVMIGEKAAEYIKEDWSDKKKSA